MNQDWQGALVRRLLLLLGGCLLLGLISGEYAWALVLGLSGYLIWTLRQLLRLQRWLHRSDPDEPPPDSAGIWGDIRDEISEMISGSGGTVEVVSGPFGDELRSRTDGVAAERDRLTSALRAGAAAEFAGEEPGQKGDGDDGERRRQGQQQPPPDRLQAGCEFQLQRGQYADDQGQQRQGGQRNEQATGWTHARGAGT